ncbi:MAG: transketolase [Acidobacteriota bacterium]|nr:transketolase [Acidobacteriota bacterium]
MTSHLDQLCINTIRTLSIDAIQKANSGHPGLPMGAAPMAYALWQNHFKHNPADPDWADRDRFVLSAGHGSMLLYSLLHLTGYEVSLDDIKNFRQWGSNTPGHPENHMTPGVEATTGPLGQGTANAVGMAIAERYLANMFNRPGYEIVDHYTYALVGDGCLMEGISAEASSMAGHLKLGKLIYLYDSNDISLDGPTSMAFTEDVARRYEAYGWQVITVENGDTDVRALNDAIAAAKTETGRPSLLVIKTTIGYGSPNKAGTSGVHGAPLGPDEIQLTRKQLGWESDGDFSLPGEALDHFHTAVTRGKEAQSSWNAMFDNYAKEHPEAAKAWTRCLNGELPDDYRDGLPDFEAGGKIATRASSGQVLNGLASKIDNLMGGDADLSCSTKTLLKGAGDFNGQSGEGRNIRYGVREHAMGAVANGITLHGGVKTFTATFGCFADYMKPALRLASLSHLPSIFVFTHDSIALGEDGPTHQPVEHLLSLRAIPNHLVIRPADATETAEAWCIALEQTETPTSLFFSRQGLPTLDRDKLAPADGVRKGGYILAEADGDNPDVILIATGSEVALALAAREALQADGKATRVVSLPCWELFEQQDDAYRNTVIPGDHGCRVAVEAGVSLGWERYVGNGRVIGVDRFGASAPGGRVMEEYGFSVDNVVKVVNEVLAD